MNKRELNARLEHALDALFSGDLDLMVKGVAERCIAARLAHHLCAEFPDRNVDVEYNRHRADPKRLRLGGENLHSWSLVTPDIVVHSRGSDDNNLLVVEVKKADDRRDHSRDRRRITRFHRAYNYRFGLFLVIPVGQAASRDGVRIELTGE